MVRKSKVFTAPDGCEFWAERNDDLMKGTWIVVQQMPGYPATEAFDDWFADEQEAEDVAQILAEGTEEEKRQLVGIGE